MKDENITLYSHGACNEVTGSKHFLDYRGKTIQIDSGMFQGKREESYVKNHSLSFDPSLSDCILLTHGHFDHSGALPVMVNNGFSGNIYSTPATRDIANIILFDSAYIQSKDSEYLKRKSEKYPERNLKVYEPLYDSADVIKTLQHFVTINHRREFVPVDGVKAEFFDAGHILGSSMICLTFEGGMRMGFSGDLGRKNLPILKDPETMYDLDYLVLEGTYGDRLHESVGMGNERLEGIVKKAVKKGGKIIIPAFTIERTQEIIYLLHLLQLENRIPKIPIYVDSPMAVNATSIFKVHSECFDEETYEDFISENINPFGFDNIKYVQSVKESKEINSISGPMIIISASGMAENGRILHHLKNNIEDERTIVTIVGFMAKHTLGRKLVEGEKSIKIFGKMYNVNAEIEILNAFSAHADYNEIKDWVSGYDLKKLKKIFLVHGESKSLLNLKEVLLSSGVNSVEILEYGKQYKIEAGRK
ncbi:MAG: MBL fold metallo-hydrolase [Acidobacteriota bacterium]